MVIGNKVTEVGDIIVIRLVEPYKNVSHVITYDDSTIGEDSHNYFEKFFRWSTDNNQYSDYVRLNDINLQKLELDPNQSFWIEYKYEAVELDTGNELEFASIALEVVTEEGRVLAEVQANAESCDPNDMSCVGNLIIEDCCDDDNIFKPYDWAQQANQLYDQLSEITTKVFGHCVKYYRAEPDERSRDSVLKEDTIFKRESVREIQVLVPDNEFPTNEFQFDPFLGMGHEGFEVHLTRKEFEEAFGANERPRERDSIFIPLNQKMYEVASVSLSDEIFQMHSYWRIRLKKWEDKQNIYNSPEIEEDLEDLTVGIKDIFEEPREEDFLKITKPQQYKTIGTGKNDFVRSDLSADIQIADDKINNNWTIVSKNYYQLYRLTKGAVAARYRKNVDISETSERAFTFWFRSKFKQSSSKINITTYTNINDNLQITVNIPHKYKVGDVVEFHSVPGYSSDIHYVKTIIDDYTFIIDSEYVANSFTNTGKVQFKEVATGLYGYNIENPSANGMSIELMEGYINVSINNENYTFKTDVDIYNVTDWYSVVVNLSNKFDQLTVYLYKMNSEGLMTVPQNHSTSLILEYSDTIDLEGPVTVNSGDTWSLIGSPIELTNIRIFEVPIEEESHDAVLNQYVVRDTQNALLVDNAAPQLKLMKLNNSR